jgi:hypothetical protein
MGGKKYPCPYPPRLDSGSYPQVKIIPIYIPVRSGTQRVADTHIRIVIPTLGSIGIFGCVFLCSVTVMKKVGISTILFFFYFINLLAPHGVPEVNNCFAAQI